jgi:hypothetical protein
LHSFILYWILQQNARLRATFLPFPVFSANVFIPGCINAIQFLQYPLQTLFESKPFVVTALSVKMRLPRSAERGNREI